MAPMVRLARPVMMTVLLLLPAAAAVASPGVPSVSAFDTIGTARDAAAEESPGAFLVRAWADDAPRKGNVAGDGLAKEWKFRFLTVPDGEPTQDEIIVTVDGNGRTSLLRREWDGAQQPRSLWEGQVDSDAAAKRFAASASWKADAGKARTLEYALVPWPGAGAVWVAMTKGAADTSWVGISAHTATGVSQDTARQAWRGDVEAEAQVLKQSLVGDKWVAEFDIRYAAHSTMKLYVQGKSVGARAPAEALTIVMRGPGGMNLTIHEPYGVGGTTWSTDMLYLSPMVGHWTLEVQSLGPSVQQVEVGYCATGLYSLSRTEAAKQDANRACQNLLIA